MNSSKITIDIAQSKEDTAAVKDIFQAFVEFLPIDLGFQGIDNELATFPKGYEFLLLAKNNGAPAGAVALKAHSPEVCEMKRLHVLPEAQGLGLGKSLCEQLIKEAQRRGYKTMLLDSLRRLKPAVRLYKSLGFKETEPYNFNPAEDVVYMRKLLKS